MKDNFNGEIKSFFLITEFSQKEKMILQEVSRRNEIKTLMTKLHAKLEKSWRN